MSTRVIMLNKELCKRCRKKYSNKRYDTWIQSCYNGNLFWTDKDNINWLNGYVFCPIIKQKEKLHRFEQGHKTKVSDNPPDDCYFKLEHLLIQKD